jgi:hypothetical protein
LYAQATACRAASARAQNPTPLPAPACLLPALQIVVLDKLDYCATLNNLASVRSHPNFKWVLRAAAAAEHV